mmetsp:Transcript_35210/g.81147  ORF Transcript_35210/g.81147 Transcript_35210/m.81147 type:complete len:203 (-) Transcript_35210:89-697(-)
MVRCESMFHYNTKATVITAVSVSLLSLAGIVIMLSVTMPGRASLPSLVTSTVLVCGLGLALAVSYLQRHPGGQRTENTKCLCVWAPCRFETLISEATELLEFRYVEIRAGEAIEWVASDVVSGLPRPAAISQKTCPCCLEDFQSGSQVAVLPCLHVFHEECVARWSFAASSGPKAACPTCRAAYTQTGYSVAAPIAIGHFCI